MILAGPVEVLAVFVLFCRIGAAIMLMPGTSSARIPVHVRLFLALAVTLGLAPLLMPQVVPQVMGAGHFELFLLIARELLFGGLIGLLARVFFLSLQSLVAFAAFSVGFGGMPGATSDEGEPLPAFVTFVMASATVLVFLTDQHWEVLRGLVASYAVVPPEPVFDPRFGLVELTDRLADTFLLTLQICSPFLIYAVIVNFTIGVANKLTPQIPIYFIALPFALAGGLFLLWATLGEMLQVFFGAFSAWLQRG